MRLINNVINNSESKKHDPIIPNYLFEDFESKFIVLIDAPFCSENEKVSKKLLK